MSMARQSSRSDQGLASLPGSRLSNASEKFTPSTATEGNPVGISSSIT